MISLPTVLPGAGQAGCDPTQVKSKAVLTAWGREGDGRTSVLREDSLVFIVQIFGPRHLSGPASAPSLRTTKDGLFAFIWTAFLD